MANELILVVEDHGKNRKLVRDVTFKGYEIIEAETGEEVERKATLTPAGARRAAGRWPARRPTAEKEIAMRTRPFLVAALVLGWSLLAPIALAGQKSCLGGLLPDLRTVVPKHLEIQNEHQREILRFTNGIANTGTGDWRMRPDPPPGTALFTNAVQEILDENGEVVCSKVVSTFEFHPEHDHWHIGDVALFEVRKARDDGTGGLWDKKVFENDRGEAQSIKTTFCLIDWYRLDDNAPTTERTYWECATSFQGISPGWVDQYHQQLAGQQIDLTGAPVGVYYLVSTTNPDGNFLEANLTNNTAWVSVRLARDSRGNPKIVEIGHSSCDSPGMCGEQATNR